MGILGKVFSLAFILSSFACATAPLTRLNAMAVESVNPTANIYVGNFLLTVARMKAEK